MIIFIALLALVVVNALGESPWGVFSVAMTMPIALFMGCYLRFLRPGKVGEVSIIGFVLLMLAIVAGRLVAESPYWSEVVHPGEAHPRLDHRRSTASSPRSCRSGCCWRRVTTCPRS